MRWVFRLIGVLIACAVMLIALVVFVPGDRVARIIEDQVTARSGRALTIEGGASFTLWPVLGLRAGDVRLANADWAGSEPMFEAAQVSFGVDVAGLIGGTIRLTEITADAPILRLARGMDGQVNWQLETAPEATGTQMPSPQTSSESQIEAPERRAITLDLLRITQARIEMREAGQAPLVLANVDLELRWPDAAGPLTLMLSAAPAGMPVNISGRIADVPALVSGATSPAVVDVRSDGSSMAFDGLANIAGEASGRLTLKAQDIGRALAAAGLDASAAPSGALNASAEATYTADRRLALRDLSFALGRIEMTGAADLDLAPVPRVTAQLNAGVLDLTGFGAAGPAPADAPGVAPAQDGSTAGAGAVGWSTDPIDASALGLVEGTIGLSVQGVSSDVTQLGRTRLKLSIERSRAVFDLIEVQAFGGQVTGQFVANNRNGLSVGGDLTIRSIEMNTLLRDLADVTRVSGLANADLKFLGVGQSQDAIMRSLSGQGGVAMGRGVIAGLDLDRLMQSGEGTQGTQGTQGTTVFDSLTASFTIAGGNLRNDDLLLSLPNYRADGAGRVGLGARDLDYLFTPVALRANAGKGLAVPVRITGPWSDPRIRPDLESALKSRFEAEQDALEQKAKDTLQRKLQEELEIEVPADQSPEDALRDKIEDEAKRGLFRLLGVD